MTIDESKQDPQDLTRVLEARTYGYWLHERRLVDTMETLERFRRMMSAPSVSDLCAKWQCEALTAKLYGTEPPSAMQCRGELAAAIHREKSEPDKPAVEERVSTPTCTALAPRVADLPSKWRADQRLSRVSGVLTCAMQLEQALAHEPNVTITGEALRLTTLLHESETHVSELLATVENLRRANSQLATAAVLPEPKSQEAVRLALKLVTGDDYMTLNGTIGLDDARDILWQKLSADFGSDRALKQCIRLLVGAYPTVTYKPDFMEVTAYVDTGHGRGVACVDTMSRNALLRLIGVLVIGSVR